ncbi:hypothetical protein BDA99DRAFT_571213 [Phascolomyces articulosus]|uniref:PDEase domain-containing protein n=1 Tax=Phascolomyces articulosus TaxID=60185 RepID=A0AAD5K351_9FUNG|nr:hypothetical protein BDA99DRAFT_571213 [Phascolomyces articulosus]
MLILKFNALSAHDLFAIERRLIRWQNRRPTVNLHLNVLDYGRTDLYGHLLGMFIELNIVEALNITPSQLLDFFIDVDTTYLNAPYHSFYHAVDIVTMLYYILIELEADRYLSRLDVAVLLLAALCHDAGHPGYNNLYQVNFKTNLALKYSNTSVLESYSVDITRDLLHKHKLLKSLSNKDNNNRTKKESTDKNNNNNATKTTTCHQQDHCWSEQEFIKEIENLILSTDMVYHYELQQQLGILEDLLSTTNSSSSSSTSSSSCCSDDDDDDDSFYSSWEEYEEDFSFDDDDDDTSTTSNSHDELKEKHRQSLSRVLLHAADISNTVRPWPISKQWSDLIVQEFFRQGDAEKAAGLDVSPGMDRDQSTQPNISLTFGDLLVQPYFQALAAFLPSARVFLDTLAENRCEWERLKDQPNSTTQVNTISSPIAPTMTIPCNNNNAMTSIQQQPERQFPNSLLPPSNTSHPSGRRVSVAAGMIVIPDHHDDYYSNYYYYYHHHHHHHHHHRKSIRKRQRSSLMLNPHPHAHSNNSSNSNSPTMKHKRPLGFRSASHSGTAHDRRRIPVHWASADLLKPIVFESPSSTTTSSMLFHTHQDKQQKQLLQQQQHQPV